MAKEFRIQIDRNLAVYLMRFASVEHDDLLQEIDEAVEQYGSEEKAKFYTDAIKHQLACVNSLNDKLRNAIMVDTDTGEEVQLDSTNRMALYPW